MPRGEQGMTAGGDDMKSPAAVQLTLFGSGMAPVYREGRTRIGINPIVRPPVRTRRWEQHGMFRLQDLEEGGAVAGAVRGSPEMEVGMAVNR